MPLSSRGRLPAVEGLDRPNTSVRVMFFDLSSTFNAIQPRLLKTKLKNTQDASWSPPWGGVLGSSHREKAQRKTQDPLEGLCVPAGLGTPRDPPGGAG
ncbi:uncharacterized protein ACNS7B_019603 isoform 2-T2 [Menidia menidia]